MEDYRTVQNDAEAEMIEKKSRFIGYCRPVKNQEEAISFINEIRALHRQATHNVYAYVLREDNIMRYSDDGEPAGTAGVPVLEVIKKEAKEVVGSVTNTTITYEVITKRKLQTNSPHEYRLKYPYKTLANQIQHSIKCNTFMTKQDYPRDAMLF